MWRFVRRTRVAELAGATGATGTTGATGATGATVRLNHNGGVMPGVMTGVSHHHQGTRAASGQQAGVIDACNLGTLPNPISISIPVPGPSSITAAGSPRPRFHTSRITPPAAISFPRNGSTLASHVCSTMARIRSLLVALFATAQSWRIDTHIHALPQAYVDALETHGGDNSGFPTPSWSIEATIKSMNHVGTSVGEYSTYSLGALTQLVIIQPLTTTPRCLVGNNSRRTNCRFGVRGSRIGADD